MFHNPATDDTAAAIAYGLPTIADSLDNIVRDAAFILAKHGYSVPMTVERQPFGHFKWLRLNVSANALDKIEESAETLPTVAEILHVGMAVRGIHLVQDHLNSAQQSRSIMAVHADQMASLATLQDIDRRQKERDVESQPEPKHNRRKEDSRKRNRLRRWEPGIFTKVLMFAVPVTAIVVFVLGIYFELR